MSGESKIIYLEDRSGAETDDQCGMKYWWSRKAGGMGLVPREEVLALRLGREVHEDFSTIAEMSDISEDAITALITPLIEHLSEDDKKQTEKMEQLYRRLGWLAAFALYVEPRIRAEYENVHVEHELTLDRTPLWVGITPDRILRHKQRRHLVYREWKSTVSASQKWLNSWKYAVQIHSSIAAVQEELGEKVAFAQVMGMMKGFSRSGRLSHPYVWGWWNTRTNEWSCEYERARGADWISMPVWEYPEGVVAWVKFCGAEVAAAQFPHTEPLFYHPGILDSWVRRRLRRQEIIRRVTPMCEDKLVREIHFPKIYRNCAPPFGDACPYLQLCHNVVAEDMAVSHPDYTQRVPHHELEITLRKEGVIP